MSLGPLTTTFTSLATCTADCFPPNYESARTAFYSPASIFPHCFASACSRVTSTAVSAAPEPIITCCPSVQGGKAFACNPDL
ncbi:hypothetical protein B0T18DRAFT_433478 [Schizothecium vesticola]|uniref:Uncharacterized protein n=1 Tax=Schizothecium vesticola TaxID=314040 RepID=A0AA40BQT2_9PEZI|nr:hypothetical protein B0T18DRAFT_433478 [Schizothecium vesticola]